MRAARVYGVLLYAYPASFRARFGHDMRATFEQDYARAAIAGVRATLPFWIRTIGGALVYGTAERFRPANRASDTSLRAKRRVIGTGFLYDCRDALRALRATPLVSVVSIASLALGIGANTALFSILNGLVLKPLPVRAPEALVILGNRDGNEWTNAIWQEIRARQHELFDGAFAWCDARFNLSDDGPTEYASGAYASGDTFDVLGVRATIGRTFTAADDVAGGGPDGAIAVISDRFWRERFDTAPDVVGRRLSLDGIAFTIIGVMPATFLGPDVGSRADVVIPLEDEALIHGASSMLPGRWTWWLEILARRKPGQSIEQVNAGLRAAQPQIRTAAAPNGGASGGFLRDPLSVVPAVQGFSKLRQRYQEPLTIILVVVAVILLMACANIASLLLARAASRRRDLVVRLALGASRLRLARTLLLESVFLAAAGAALGLVVARIGSAFLVRQIAAPRSAVFLDLGFDGRVLTFTMATAAVTALLFGLAPAVGISGTTPNEILKQQSRAAIGEQRWSARNALVIVQVALSLLLVAGAGLFVRTFASLVTVPLGMTPRSLLAIDVNAQRSQTAAAARDELFERLRTAAESVPGVKSAALSVITPVMGQGWNTVIQNEDATREGSDRARVSWVNAVSPRFFATYGMTLISGRDFGPADRAGAPLVAIVNETFARKFFGEANPIGREFRGRISAPGVTTYQIVGVASDAVYRRLREGMVPTLYIPLAQMPAGPSITLAVQSAPEMRGPLSPVLTRALSAVDGAVALSIRPFDDYVAAASAQERLVAMLASFFGALALLLAGLGLYGVTSYGVSLRRAEIGVRMALGADPGGVVRLVLGRVGWLVCAGVTAGMALAWWASRFISATLLYGVSARDAATFAGAAAVLVSVSAAAAWLPARRAARIHPAEVLRET